MKGFVVFLYMVLIVIILLAVIYLIGMLSAPGSEIAGAISGTVEDVGRWINNVGSGIGIVRGRDYKIEMTAPAVGGTRREGEMLTVTTTYSCDFDEPCTFLAWARLKDVEHDNPDNPYVYAQLIKSSSCCNNRRSEATEMITVQPDEKRSVTFHLYVPYKDESYACGGYSYKTSDWSASRIYTLRVGADTDCYGSRLMELRPLRLSVEESHEQVPPVQYYSPTADDGRDIHHYIKSVRYGGSECQFVSGYQGYAYDCGPLAAAEYLVVETSIKNNNELDLKFLTEAIIHSKENYNPWNVPGTFVLATRSCCGDTFSSGWFIHATSGSSSTVQYRLLVPKDHTYGLCNNRDYYSPSSTYYLKISDYTDCGSAGGFMVHDIAPILIMFRS